MEQPDIEKLVGELEIAVDRLRSLYEQYFMGIEKIEPTVPRKDVDRRVHALRKEQIRNTALRFRFQMLLQRYNTYQTHWQRICREIENGTYTRHVLRAQRRFAPGRTPTTPKPPPPEKERSLADELAELDREFGAPPLLSLDLEDEQPTRRDLTAAARLGAGPAKPAAAQLPRAPGPAAQPAAGPNRAAAPAPAEAAPRSLPRPGVADAAPRSPAPPPASPVAPPSHPRPAVVAVRAPAVGAAPPSSAAKAGAAAAKAASSPTAAAPRAGATSPLGAGTPGAAAPAQRTVQASAARPATAAQAASAVAASQPKPPEPNLPDERVRQLYSQYIEAKRRQNEPLGAITYDTVAKSLHESSARLRQRHGRAVDFEVVIKDGRAILRPVLR